MELGATSLDQLSDAQLEYVDKIKAKLLQVCQLHLSSITCSCCGFFRSPAAGSNQFPATGYLQIIHAHDLDKQPSSVQALQFGNPNPQVGYVSGYFT